jgi:hypothetical protein
LKSIVIHLDPARAWRAKYRTVNLIVGSVLLAVTWRLNGDLASTVATWGVAAIVSAAVRTFRRRQLRLRTDSLRLLDVTRSPLRRLGTTLVVPRSAISAITRIDADEATINETTANETTADEATASKTATDKATTNEVTTNAVTTNDVTASKITTDAPTTALPPQRSGSSMTSRDAEHAQRRVDRQLALDAARARMHADDVPLLAAPNLKIELIDGHAPYLGGIWRRFQWWTGRRRPRPGSKRPIWRRRRPGAAPPLVGLGRDQRAGRRNRRLPRPILLAPTEILIDALDPDAAYAQLTAWLDADRTISALGS